jgi:hypothetical protein
MAVESVQAEVEGENLSWYLDHGNGVNRVCGAAAKNKKLLTRELVRVRCCNKHGEAVVVVVVRKISTLQMEVAEASVAWWWR